MNIRLEQPKDFREVENLTREAFWNVYRPGICTEALQLMLDHIWQTTDIKSLISTKVRTDQLEY